MIKNLESNYNCAQASADLHQLKEEWKSLQASKAAPPSPEWQEQMNRLENQIRFIQNKCDISHGD